MTESIYDATKEPMPSAGAFVGYNVILQIAGEDIAKAQRITLNVRNGIRQFYVVSSRTPLNVETSFLIRGNIRQIYFNTALLRLAIGLSRELVSPHGTHLTGAEWSALLGTENSTPSFTSSGDFHRLPEVTISCILRKIDSEKTSSQAVTIRGVKFDTWDFTIDPNDVILENVDFFAERFEIAAPVGEAVTTNTNTGE